MPPKTTSKISKILERSKVKLPISLKIKLAELILGFRSRKKKFGLFVILGWQTKWWKFTDVPDSNQDIFTHRHINIMNIKNGHKRYRDIAATLNFDGAILINAKGQVTHSGIIIEGLRPRIVARKINPGHFADLSEQFGFRRKVHTRHLSAIVASYVFKNTAVFTVSEETGTFHIFEEGKIIYFS